MNLQELARLQYDVICGRRRNETLSYFGRAIMGGRQNLANDRAIVGEMQKYSVVLSQHTVWDNVFEYEKLWRELHPDISIAWRDPALVRASKRFAGDVTVKSSGLGFEIREAELAGVGGLLFCHEDAKNLPTVERILHYSKMPHVYYNDGNIGEIVKSEIAKLFS